MEMGLLRTRPKFWKMTLLAMEIGLEYENEIFSSENESSGYKSETFGHENKTWV